MKYPYIVKCQLCGEEMRSSHPSKHNRHKRCITPKRKYRRKFRKIRLNIVVRDQYICKRCGRDVMKKDPTERMAPIHHIDGNYKNNEPTNLVQLCESCHVRTHREGLIHYKAKNIKIPEYQNIVSPKEKFLFKNIN